MYLLEKCTNEKEAERWSLSRQSRGKIGLTYTMNIGCSIAHISNILTFVQIVVLCGTILITKKARNHG